MSLPRMAIGRPVFTTMVALIVILLGGVSLTRLPIDLMPDITFPMISVSTTYENASPSIIEELVTRPIEEGLSAVPGVTEISSSSAEGISVVRVRFAWGTDLAEASADVRDRLDRVIGRLPDEVERPILFKFDTSAFPVMMMGVKSELDPIELRTLIEDRVKYRIEQKPGVAQFSVWGGLEREIRVALDPDRLRALEISASDVVDAITAANVNQPAGFIERGNYEVTLRAPGEFESTEEIEDTLVTMRAGAPIRVRDLAKVQDAHALVRRIARIDGVPAMRLSVTKQSGANTVEVADRVLKEIDLLNNEYRGQFEIVTIVNTAEYIQNSIENVAQSAIIGGGLAVFILLLFLRNLRSTLVITVVIPVSIIATFALLYFCGITLNLMTLGGLALGVGMLMDNAIVVIENTCRLGEYEGQAPAEAAENGTGEVLMAIIASTLTTLAVFFPLMFIQGMAGIMFRQLALVVSFSLLCSLVVAVTLVPMLSAKWIRHRRPEDALAPPRGRAERLFRWSERLFTLIEDDYKRLLHLALGRRWLVASLAAALLGVSIFLALGIGTELMPKTDEGEVNVTLERDVGTRLSLLDETTRKAEAIVQGAVPELVRMNASMGADRWARGGANRVSLRLDVGKRAARRAAGMRSDVQISAALRKELAVLPGVKVRVREGSGLIGRMTGGGENAVSVEVRGYDFEESARVVEQVRRIMDQVDGLKDIRVSREAGQPEEQIRPDRVKAEIHQLTVRRISEFLETCLAGTVAGTYRERGKEYDIRVRLGDAERLDLDDIMNLVLRNSEGALVALKTVMSTRPSLSPTFIERRNQERVVTINANLENRDLGSVIAELDVLLDRGKILPQGFDIQFVGDYEDQQSAFKELVLGMALAIILVYMVMACQYESLRDPLVVMFTVPLGFIGVSFTLFLTRSTFNVQSFIGCIMLAGIVVNNAILLVDQINLLRRRDGYALRPAIEEAGRRRLRPILMTSLTTILGVLPLALGMGEGGEAQAPMARAVAGGLASATFITLLVVPVVYSAFEEFHFRRRPPEADAETAEPGAAGAPAK